MPAISHPVIIWSDDNITVPDNVERNVQIAGSFNDWKLADMIKVESNGATFWRFVVDAKMYNSPVRHQYKFFIDGQWKLDSAAPQVLNEFGTFNNFIDVESTENNRLEHDQYVEVERKFRITNDVDHHALLTTHGFKTATTVSSSNVTCNGDCDNIDNGCSILLDIYYDTPMYDLIRRDMWLRRRNNDWELKYKVNGCGDEVTDSHHSATTVYKELINELDIVDSIWPIVSGEAKTACCELATLIKDGSLRQLAKYVTRRKSYSRLCDDNGLTHTVNVVIDETDFGHRCGEIEIVLKSGNDRQLQGGLGRQEYDTKMQLRAISCLDRVSTELSELLAAN